MPHLVAIDLPGGAEFVDALQRAWDDGDAVYPVDRRLPPPARAAAFHAAAPTVLVDHAGRRTLDGHPVEPGDALVVATSGSTGSPKAVVLTHDAVRASALATTARLGVTPDDTWLACLPLAHVGGLSVVTRALHTATGLVVHDGFDAAAVTAAAHDGATAVSLVPTALARIDPAMFRIVVVGGARPPSDRPANVRTTYGLTETASGVVYDGHPLDGVEIRIVDGEVHVRAPMVMRCYRDGSTAVDRDGWLHTGDIGHWRHDGRLHVEGRRGDLIVTGGENVWPDPVERIIARHPDVADVAVTGTDDLEWGQRVVAWIVPRGRLADLGDIRGLVSDELPAYCAPKELVFIDRIPRTALGKVQRHLLDTTRRATPPEV